MYIIKTIIIIIRKNKYQDKQIYTLDVIKNSREIKIKKIKYNIYKLYVIFLFFL